MKRIITAALAAALLTALTGARAGEAGTAADPLVTKAYIDTTYTASVIAAGDTLIDQSLAEISATIGLLLLPDDRPPMKYTSGPETFVAGTAGSVTLGPGLSLILTGGSAVLSVLSGQVIDISTGEAVENGASLSALKRYFCTEGTFADLTLAASSTFVLDGPYSPGEGISRPYALYSDVSGTEWFGDAARYAHENKLFYDWDAQRFRPDEPAVRAEVIYAIWVLAGSPLTDFVSPFTDLSEDWYVMAANWAFEQGITNGSGNLEIFGPRDNISREQLVTMLWRWLLYSGKDVSQTSDLSVFSDAETISPYALDAVSWAVAMGYINGYSQDVMGPLYPISRAQISAIFMRYSASQPDYSSSLFD